MRFWRCITCGFRWSNYTNVSHFRCIECGSPDLKDSAEEEWAPL